MSNTFMHFIETGQIDFSSGHIKFFNVDMVMVPSATMAFIHHSCKNKDVFYQAGLNQVKTAFAAYEKQFKVSQIDQETFYNLFAPTLQLGGWGNVEFKEIDFSEVEKTIINVKDNPFALIYRGTIGKQKESVDDYLRGVFEAGIYLISGIKIKCIETKCIAKGDNVCEFRIKII